MAYSESQIPLQRGEHDPYASAPEGLLEQLGSPGFPHLSIEQLRHLMREGWAGFGVGTAVINERGEILMLSHAESASLSEGSTGPLTEKSRLRIDAREVESTEQTIYRAFQEELDIDKPELLRLKAQQYGAWMLHAWPSGDKKPADVFYTVNPVVVMPNENADKIRRLIGSKEVRTAAFVPVEVVRSDPKLRPGVLEWLGSLSAKELLSRQNGSLRRLRFSLASLDAPGWEDAIFSKLSI